MKFTETKLVGLWILEPVIHGDHRGYFMESYKKDEFDKHIGTVDFIQDNESRSSFGVFRGLHYQKGDAAQAKLVRAIEGKVLDIALDIRKNSSTFGQYEIIELSSENKKQLYIPRGFAHGFLVLSETALFSYKVDNTYNSSSEGTVNCFDPSLNIQLPLEKNQLILSEKDKQAPFLKEINV